MIASLSSGITNVTKDVLGLSIAVISYGWLYEKLSLFHMEATWLLYVIAFFALDFAGYWTHRIAHEYNIFWNNHIIHHSSEEFNLACALRQGISSIFKIFAVFFNSWSLVGSTTGSNSYCCSFAFVCPILVSYPAYRQNGFSGKNHRHPFPSSRSPCDQSGISGQKLRSDLHLLGQMVWDFSGGKPGNSSCVWCNPTCTNLESNQNQFHAPLAVDQRCLESQKLDR